jgi:GTP:adenosylcobinamide-phosphate guanylyltransferase
MDAIVTAGGIPLPGEPLYPFTLGESKALLDVAGKPMIQWVLDALSGSQAIERVVVVGLKADAPITCSKPVLRVQNRGDMVENILGSIDMLRSVHPQMDAALIVASDIPAITSEMVDWLVNLVQKSDGNVYYNAITRQVMESRYPSSKRTYVRLQDHEVCGGDMNALRVSMLATEDPKWKRLVDARKSPVKQASIIGFDLLLSLLLRRLSLAQAEKRISRRLGIQGRLILCPYAEVGMDVDKPHQLEQMRADLARRKPA